MPFNRDQVTDLLVQCHRRCCICHRFCGFKMETDHIVPKGEGGSDDIDNAIPVCFECHAEIHLYNPAHPRGRRYAPGELRKHRDQWLELCKTSARFVASVPARIEVGPLQALIDELEFNSEVVARHTGTEIGAPLETDQFNRCLTGGALSLMNDSLKEEIYRAYVYIKRANAFVLAMPSFDVTSNPWAEALNRARAGLVEARPHITAALEALRRHLGAET